MLNVTKENTEQRKLTLMSYNNTWLDLLGSEGSHSETLFYLQLADALIKLSFFLFLFR